MILVTCWIGPGLDYYHAAHWLAGLLDLQRSGRIRLQFRPPDSNSPGWTADPIAVLFRVESDRDSRLCVVDFRDSSQEFSSALLSDCHIYFKRSYYPPDLLPLGPEAAKVRPLGLNYACRTRGLVAAIGTTLLPWLIRSPIAGTRWLTQQTRRIQAIPPSKRFERRPNAPTEKTVLFQTRVWEEGETGVEPPEAINEPRVALIRMLREAFGPRFRGGLVPTPLARSRYPDALARQCWKKTKYVEMAGQQAIAVYTRGLHHSTAWKMPEYLAASQCIVAEPPRNLSPVPLVDGVNYLGFSQPNECVAACQALLNDASRIEAMREANHRYYRNEVAPASWVSHRIEESIALATTDSNR